MEVEAMSVAAAIMEVELVVPPEPMMSPRHQRR
jgi:hypothetical protein